MCPASYTYTHIPYILSAGTALAPCIVVGGMSDHPILTVM